MSKTIFITKSINELQQLVDFCFNNNIELIAHSFLQFEAIPFTIEKPFEAIFFGSPRAVDFYLAQETIPENTLLACVGEITAKSLTDKGYSVAYTGVSAGDTSQIAKDFKNFIGDNRILFPQSNISHRSISSEFSIEKIEEINIYKTATYPKTIPTCSQYIFTSPSNVDGFLINNSIPVNCQIIAWGKTTEKYLIEKGFIVQKTLVNSTVEELVGVI